MATPTVKKLQLGNELRHLREAAGLGQVEAGRLIEKVQSKIAMLEAGQASITPGDLQLLLKGYNVTDQERIDFFLELRRNNQQRGRWTGYRSAYADSFRMYVDLEEDAIDIRSVQAEIPPGLLQCEAFVRALYAQNRVFARSEDFENLVHARVARQEIFTKPEAPQAAFVISESALRRMHADSKTMYEQINYMIELSKLPNIRLQVLPFVTRSREGASANYQFTLLRIPSPGAAGPLEFVYLEDAADNRYLDDKEAVLAHDILWSRFTAVALNFEDSRNLMHEVAAGYR